MRRARVPPVRRPSRHGWGTRPRRAAAGSLRGRANGLSQRGRGPAPSVQRALVREASLARGEPRTWSVMFLLARGRPTRAPSEGGANQRTPAQLQDQDARERLTRRERTVRWGRRRATPEAQGADLTREAHIWGCCVDLLAQRPNRSATWVEPAQGRLLGMGQGEVRGRVGSTHPTPSSAGPRRGPSRLGVSSRGRGGGRNPSRSAASWRAREGGPRCP